MQLDNDGFSRKELMDFINQSFEKLFEKKILLRETSFSEKVGGYFILKYEYFPKKYTLFFEHEKLYFSIRITRSDGAFTFISQIYPNKINGELRVENISYAIQKVYDALEKEEVNIVFYRIKKNKRVIADKVSD